MITLRRRQQLPASTIHGETDACVRHPAAACQRYYEEDVVQINPSRYARNLIDLQMPFHLLKMDLGGLDFINEHYGPLITNGILSDVAGMIEGVRPEIVWGYARQGVFYIFFIEENLTDAKDFANSLIVALMNSRFRVSFKERAQLFARLGWTSYPEHGDSWKSLRSTASRKALEEYLRPLPDPRIYRDDRRI